MTNAQPNVTLAELTIDATTQQLDFYGPSLSTTTAGPSSLPLVFEAGEKDLHGVSTCGG